MTKRQLIIGFDLGDEYSQLSYAQNLIDEPEQLEIGSKDNAFLTPTAVGLLRDKKGWVYGWEAVQLAKENKVHLVTNLLDKIRKGHRIKIYGSLYDPIYLIERFISNLFTQLKVKWPSKSIRQMVVTIDELDATIVRGVYKALENLNIYRDRVQIRSYSNSYLAYVLSQERGIWANDVALFDFGQDKLTYSQISIERRNKPYLVNLVQKDYSDSISYKDIDKVKESGNYDYILENVINDALYKQIISSIYFTGKGFIDGISMKLVQKISKGRRIFIGQNLYCRGASYLARQVAGGEKLSDFVFLLEDTSHNSVWININDNNRGKELVLMDLGKSIWEPPETIDLILDNESQVNFLVRDKRGQTLIKDSIILNDLPKRPKRTTRIEVSLEYIDKSRFKIKVKDRGFGDLYPATDKLWEKEVVIHG